MDFRSLDMPSPREAKSDYFRSSCMKRKQKKKDRKKDEKNK